VSTAHAQQAFEEKYVAARANGTELVPLPTIGIVPVATAPLDTNVAEELSEAIQRQLDTSHDTRLEVITRASGAKISWAFVARNAPRAQHDAFTQQFTDQLLACVHSLDNDLPLGSLNLLLVAGSLESQQERDEANAAGAQMLVNWKADHCATKRNTLPFPDQNRGKLVVASRGMLTDLFDGTVYNGQGLLDLISALSPVYFGQGGFWTTEMLPRLHTQFEAGVRAGLLTTQETASTDVSVRTFWDWVIDVVLTNPTVVRSFIANTAAGCARSVPELSTTFQLSRCVSDGKLRLVPLRVAGQDFTTVQKVLP
jgi:hypothetical protein